MPFMHFLAGVGDQLVSPNEIQPRAEFKLCQAKRGRERNHIRSTRKPRFSDLKALTVAVGSSLAEMQRKNLASLTLSNSICFHLLEGS